MLVGQIQPPTRASACETVDDWPVRRHRSHQTSPTKRTPPVSLRNRSGTPGHCTPRSHGSWFWVRRSFSRRPTNQESRRVVPWLVMRFVAGPGALEGCNGGRWNATRVLRERRRRKTWPRR